MYLRTHFHKGIFVTSNISNGSNRQTTLNDFKQCQTLAEPAEAK